MADMRCVLTSPEELLFEGKVRSVVVPAVDGELGILPRHAPLVGALSFGELRLELEDGSRARYFVHGGGFVEVLNDEVTVLATNVEDVTDEKLEIAETHLKDLLGKDIASHNIEELDAHRDSVNVAKRRLQVVKKR